MTNIASFGILLASQFFTVHRTASPQANLPDTTDYLFATANHIVDTGKRAIKPADLEVVLGPLLLTGEMDRQPTLEDYLLRTFTEDDGSFDRREASRTITNGLHGFRQRLRSKILKTTGDIDRARLHLDLSRVPVCTPEIVQSITRLAATRWLIDVNEEGRETFISDLQARCDLNPLQTQMLRELLLRNGGQFSYNAEDPTEKVRRKNALQTLRDRLDAHFGEKTIRPYGGTYFALPSLLAHVPGLSLEQVLRQHDAHFGPYLPVPQLLLHNRFAHPETPSRRSARLQRHQELTALTAARDHIQESGITSTDLDVTCEALDVRIQEVRSIIERLSGTRSVKIFDPTAKTGAHHTRLNAAQHSPSKATRMAGIEASLQRALAEEGSRKKGASAEPTVHHRGERIETPSGSFIIRRRPVINEEPLTSGK